MLPPNPVKPDPLVTISIGPEPSVTVRTPSNGLSPNNKINKIDQSRPEPIQSVHHHPSILHTNSKPSEPQTRLELIKRLGYLGYPDAAIKRDLERILLPPTLYDKTPPTLYDEIYPGGPREESEFLPPRLTDYLPPTLFDSPAPSPGRNSGSERFLRKKKEPKMKVPNPFSRFRSVKDKKEYYRQLLLPSPPPAKTFKPEKLEVSSEDSSLSAGVGNKNGPSPSQVYKASLRFPPKQLISPKKPPAIKFEVINETSPAIKFDGSEEVYPVIYYSDRKSINPEDYLRSKLIEKGKTYSYKTKIRYRNNRPVQEREREEMTDVLADMIATTPRNVDSNGFISVLDRDRLYRNDFPAQSERRTEIDNYTDNVIKRQTAPSQVPCQGETPCVLVKENSSIRATSQDVILSSQVSSLPFPTQLPRPPTKLPYLPFAAYKTKPTSRNEFVKTLPSPTLSSVRTRPQYPYHNSYVLAKLKRKDVPK